MTYLGACLTYFTDMQLAAVTGGRAALEPVYLRKQLETGLAEGDVYVAGEGDKIDGVIIAYGPDQDAQQEYVYPCAAAGLAGKQLTDAINHCRADTNWAATSDYIDRLTPEMQQWWYCHVRQRLSRSATNRSHNCLISATAKVCRVNRDSVRKLRCTTRILVYQINRCGPRVPAPWFCATTAGHIQIKGVCLRSTAECVYLMVRVRRMLRRNGCVQRYTTTAWYVYTFHTILHLIPLSCLSYPTVFPRSKYSRSMDSRSRGRKTLEATRADSHSSAWCASRNNEACA